MFDDKTQDNGGDIRFTDADDVLLDHEIEEWDNSGEAWIWVRIPSISSDSDTEFYMYYGNPAAPDGQNPAGVWDDSFKMVQHLEDDPDNSKTQDSTVNDNDSTKKGAGEPVEIEGKIGRGQDFDGTDDKITVSDSSSLSFTGNQLTIEAWVKVDTLPGTHPDNDEIAILRKDEQWQIAFQTANSIRNLVWTTGTTGWTAANDENYNFSTDTWYYWTFVYNGSKICHLIDAQPVGDLHTVTGNIRDNDKDAEIGRCVYTDKFLDGIIDEVRVSNTARSADWITTQYLSMTDNLMTYTNHPPHQPDDLGPTDYRDGGWVNNNTPILEFSQSDPDGDDSLRYRIQITKEDDGVVDYTSELLAQGEASFTVGQAEGDGVYTEGYEGQTLEEGKYYWQVRSIDESGFTSAWVEGKTGPVAFCLDTTAEEGGSAKDKYRTNEDITVSVSGFTPDSYVDVYVVSDYHWHDEDPIPPDGGDIFAHKTATADGDGQVQEVIWEAPLKVGEYDIVFDANQNGKYDVIPDLVDDPNHPGFTIVATAVGGEVYPVDKAALLLPWLGLGLVLILALGGALIIRRH